MVYCVQKNENIYIKYCAKIFSHYTDIVIFVLGYFNTAHPVLYLTQSKYCVERIHATRAPPDILVERYLLTCGAYFLYCDF